MNYHRKEIKEIYYYQTADEYCMHTNDILVGMHQLGIKVQSNIANYPFIQQTGDFDINQPYFVSTTGNTDTDFRRSWRYIFIDGRDSDAINDAQLQDWRVERYFKCNLALKVNPKLSYLPSCCSEQQFSRLKRNSIDGRGTYLSFVTGHLTNGREKVTEWVGEIKAAYANHPMKVHNEPIWSNSVAVNDRYPKAYCNYLSLDYLDLLEDSYISINAPGGNGGVSTKKFYEILAAGCICFNYVPKDYTQKLNNILDVIPDNVGFDPKWVHNFSSREELHELLDSVYEIGNIYEAQAIAAQNWILNHWRQIDKARYILQEIEKGLDIL